MIKYYKFLKFFGVLHKGSFNLGEWRGSNNNNYYDLVWHDTHSKKAIKNLR